MNKQVFINPGSTLVKRGPLLRMVAKSISHRAMKRWCGMDLCPSAVFRAAPTNMLVEMLDRTRLQSHFFVGDGELTWPLSVPLNVSRIFMLRNQVR